MDIEQLRHETPGCRSGLHFNSAGAALMPRPVLKSLLDHLILESEIGGYEAADRAEEQIEHTYKSLARLVGGKAQEIALIENATRAWDMAFYAIPLSAGDRILTSVVDYDSNFVAYLQRAQQTGASVEAVPAAENGELDLAALEAMLDERVKLISISHAPTSNGLINPVEAIGRIAKARGILYLVDACQTVGQMPIDVDKIGCSFLTGTGRKFLRGPRGTGFLWVREDLIKRYEPPLIDFHAAKWVDDDRYEVRHDARRFECWESYVAGRIGLGVAVDYALDLGLDAIRERVRYLAATLRKEIAAVPGALVTDQGLEQSGIVTFSLAGRQPAEVKTELMSRCAAVTIATCQSSRMSMIPRGLEEGVVRASLHYYNTEDEIERFGNFLRELVG